MPILELLEKKGDEIISNADSIIVEVDMDKEIIKKVVSLAKQYNKKLYGVVSNMSIAVERRDFLKHFDCFICNQLEAGMLFMEDYSQKSPEELRDILAKRVTLGRIPSMIVTMGGNGAVYADMNGDKGICPPQRVRVKDTTGAGDIYHAAFTYFISSGYNVTDSMRRSNWRICRDWKPPCRFRNYVIGECVSEIPS